MSVIESAMSLAVLIFLLVFMWATIFEAPDYLSHNERQARKWDRVATRAERRARKYYASGYLGLGGSQIEGAAMARKRAETWRAER